MTDGEIYFTKMCFKNAIFKYDGQQFEDFFVCIMTKIYPNFNAVKAYGNEGDHKNDGFDKSTGTFYQVFAPENILKPRTINEAVNKLEKDFTKLYDHWNSICPINYFYFVINDKYKGVSSRINEKCIELNSRQKYKHLKLNLFTDVDLESEFDKLNDNQKFDVIGYIPSVRSDIVSIEALSETVEYICNKEIDIDDNNSLVVPDFDEKIKFNFLNNRVNEMLNNASYQEGILTDFFNNQLEVNQLLQYKFHSLYLKSKTEYPCTMNDYSNKRFFYILKEASPKQTMSIKDAVLVLMAHYFSSCDIFEEPK